MKVGIYHVGDNIHYLRLGSLAAAVAQTHGYEVVHLTDMKTPPIARVDTVIRRKMQVPLAVFRMQHHQIEGEWAFIDTDVLIHKPVHEDVFFPIVQDIAVAERKHDDGTNSETADELYKEMPYNMGVVFSQSPEFWRDVEKELLTYDAEKQHWMGDQLAMNRILAKEKRAMILSCGYNFPPGKDGKLHGAHVVHYKGKRKPLMIDHAYKILHGADCKSA